MCLEACTFDLRCPFIHASNELSIVPFGFFSSFSIPCIEITSLCCFTQNFFMLFWCPLTIIHDKSSRIDFWFWTRTNLSCWKLKFNWPFSHLRINHSLEMSLVPSVCHQWKMDQLKAPEVAPWTLEVLGLPSELSEQLHHWRHRQDRPLLPSMGQTLSLEKGWAGESSQKMLESAGCVNAHNR